jgi:hypothetical protein
MIPLLLALLLSACAGPTWQDVPWSPDPQATAHNQRVCAERGLVWDAGKGACQ